MAPWHLDGLSWQFHEGCRALSWGMGFHGTSCAFMALNARSLHGRPWHSRGAFFEKDTGMSFRDFMSAHQTDCLAVSSELS